MAHFNLDEYETVAARIEKFWTDNPTGEISTWVQFDDGSRVLFAAKAVRDATAEASASATGHAEEVRGEGMVNRTSAVENGETSAIGRALANLGYAPTDKRPSREEMTKVARANTTATTTPVAATATPSPTPAKSEAATENVPLSELAQKIYSDGLRIGKHKGEAFDTLPDNYLSWIVDKYGGQNPQYADQDAATKDAARYEQARRSGTLPTSGVEGLAATLTATISDEDIPF